MSSRDMRMFAYLLGGSEKFCTKLRRSNLKQNIDTILSETSNRICNLILESVTKNQYDSIVKELESILETKIDINQTVQVPKVILINKESIKKITTTNNSIFKKLQKEISQIKDEYIDIVKFTGDKNLMLKCCAYMGNLEAVKFLVEKGADIRADYDNDSALRWSAEKGHLEVVKFLVEKGANIHACDDYALRWSAENGHLEVVKFLVEKGADIHAENDYALRWSAENGHLEVVKFLVESGANIHAYNDYALRWSAIKGHFDVVKFLVESGANIHANNDYALQWSAQNDHFEVVKILVKQYAADNKPIPDGAITNKINDSNKIILMYAKHDQYKLFNEELVKMLTLIKSILN